jgi:hypothetical protein
MKQHHTNKQTNKQTNNTTTESAYRVAARRLGRLIGQLRRRADAQRLDLEFERRIGGNRADRFGAVGPGRRYRDQATLVGANALQADVETANAASLLAEQQLQRFVLLFVCWYCFVLFDMRLICVFSNGATTPVLPDRSSNRTSRQTPTFPKRPNNQYNSNTHNTGFSIIVLFCFAQNEYCVARVTHTKHITNRHKINNDKTPHRIVQLDKIAVGSSFNAILWFILCYC